jgi:hypothetical protein
MRFKVFKSTVGDTLSELKLLNDERLVEIAQMLSGTVVSDSALNHAKALSNTSIFVSFKTSLFNYNRTISIKFIKRTSKNMIIEPRMRGFICTTSPYRMRAKC